MATKSELRRRRGGGGGGGGGAAEGRNGVDKEKPKPEAVRDEADPNSKLRRRSTSDLSVHVNTFDVAVIAALLIIGFAVRGYKLWYPQAVIFDEVHYLKFIRWTLKGEFFFDVNPVFGKLALAAVARIFNFDTTLPDYENPGDELPNWWVAAAARAPAAIFGAITVPIFFRVCRLLRLSTWASVVGACFLLFDSMHVIQSRIAMVDSVLVFFTCSAMLSALIMWNAKNRICVKRKMQEPMKFMDMFELAAPLFLTGVLAGLAVSTRWTAFATPVLIAFVSTYGVAPFLVEPMHFIECIVLLGSMAMSYMGSFVVYFLFVRKSGTGDLFMSEAFRACLLGTAEDYGDCKMTLWKRALELNETIYRYSKDIRGKDRWGSSWFLWIFNYRGALYFRKEHPDGRLSLIYVLMNPAMNWICNALIGIFFLVLFYNIRYRKTQYSFGGISDPFRDHLRRGCTLFFGWIGSMLPTMVVYRSGPLYQYMPGLFFAQALAACGFDLIPPKARPAVAITLISAMGLAFVYWSPWVYATPLTEASHAARRWLPRWD